MNRRSEICSVCARYLREIREKNIKDVLVSLNSDQLSDKALLKKYSGSSEDAAKIQSRIKRRSKKMSYLFAEMNLLRGLKNNHTYKSGERLSIGSRAIYKSISKADDLYIVYKNYNDKMD